MRINLYRLSESDMSSLRALAKAHGVSMSALATHIVQDMVGTTPRGRVKKYWKKRIDPLDVSDMPAVCCEHNEEQSEAAKDDDNDLPVRPDEAAPAPRLVEVPETIGCDSESRFGILGDDEITA